jgi:hypothetical protein
MMRQQMGSGTGVDLVAMDVKQDTSSYRDAIGAR